MEFTHIANPVRVKGQVIAEVTSADDGYGTKLTLADGTNYVVSDSMTVRHYPVPGDYLVTQEDGYQYLNPKDVFERKYALISERKPSPHELDLRLKAMQFATGHHDASAEEIVQIANTYLNFMTGIVIVSP